MSELIVHHPVSFWLCDMYEYMCVYVCVFVFIYINKSACMLLFVREEIFSLEFVFDNIYACFF